MKQALFGITTVITLSVAVFTYAQTDLGFRSNTNNHPLIPSTVPTISESSDFNYRPTPKSSINSTSKGIQLHFRDYPLGDILKNIHDETGIFFDIPPQMANSAVSIDIEAKNWKNSIRKLITDYSRIEIWTNRPKTSQIWLMESTLQD